MNPRPAFIKSLDEVEQDNPALVQYMKRHNGARFVDCNVVIGSFPSGSSGPCVYGYFVVDMVEVERAFSMSLIKQDFIVVSVPSGKAEYFTGKQKAVSYPRDVQNIAAFCKRFGAGASMDAARMPAAVGIALTTTTLTRRMSACRSKRKYERLLPLRPNEQESPSA